MKKLLHSDWLRAVQCKCNNSAKCITPVQILDSDYDWLKDNRKFSKPMTSRKMMTKLLYGNFAKGFLELEKMASRKTFRHFLHANFFNVFQKAKIVQAESSIPN